MALLRSSTRLRRAVAPVALALAVGVCTPVSTAAAPALEYAVKANYLYKFGPFVEWPSSAFAASTAPFKVCVLGNDPFDAALDEAVRGQTVSGHPVVVRRLQRVAGDPDCQVLYIARSAAQRPADILHLLRDAPVLTVTDEAQGVEGGIVHFVLRDGRVRFAIDQQAAKTSGLVLSSKLLGLAVEPTRKGDRP